MTTFGDIFEVILGKAYYNQGFFNIRIKHSNSIGSDGQHITVQLGDKPDHKLVGYINRTANPNKTPRIMLGKEYTNWIKKHFKSKDSLRVEILTETALILHNKKSTKA